MLCVSVPWGLPTLLVEWYPVSRFGLRGNPMLTRICKVFVVALLSTSVAANFSRAATVSNDGGTILASTGDGFQPIRSSMELPPGGQVMVKSGGLATITYAGGCT